MKQTLLTSSLQASSITQSPIDYAIEQNQTLLEKLQSRMEAWEKLISTERDQLQRDLASAMQHFVRFFDEDTYPRTLLEKADIMDALVKQAHQLMALYLPRQLDWPASTFKLASLNFYHLLLEQSLITRLSLSAQIAFYLQASKLYRAQAMYQEALFYLTRALSIANQNASLTQQQTKLCGELSQLECLQRARHSWELLPSIVLKKPDAARWRGLCQLLTNLCAYQEQSLVNRFYTFLIKKDLHPFFDTTLEHLEDARVSADTLVKWLDLWQPLLEMISIFKLHGQYTLAAHWYERLLQQKPSRAIEGLAELRQQWHCQQLQLEEQARDKQATTIVSAQSPSQGHWLTYRKQLLQARKQFQQQAAKNIVLAQQAYSQAIQTLLQTMLTDIGQDLGPAPMAFTVVGFGSIARQDMGLYSDIDIAILINDASGRQHPYFRALIANLTFSLNSCGDAWLLENDQKIGVGLQLDSGDFAEAFWQDLPPVEAQQSVSLPPPDPFINTPPGMATWIADAHNNPSKKPFRGLYAPVALFTQPANNTLLADYQRELQTKFDEPKTTFPTRLRQHAAVQWLQDDIQSYLSALKLYPQGHQLKACALKPVISILAALAHYEGIDVISSPQPCDWIDQLIERERFAFVFGQAIKELLYFLYRLRFQAESQQGVRLPLLQQFSTSTSAIQQAMVYRLTQQETRDYQRYLTAFIQPWLRYLQSLCWEAEKVRPLVDAIYLLPSFLNQFDLFALWIQQDAQWATVAEPALKLTDVLVWLLAQQKANVGLYSHYHRNLPDHKRNDFIDSIEDLATVVHKDNIIALLGPYPSKNGSRWSVLCAKAAWQIQVKQMFVDLASSANAQKITVATLQRLKLDREPMPIAALIAQQWFDTKDNLKTNNLPGRRTVLAICHTPSNSPAIAMHCKFYPELPGIEYAVERLHQLVVGHGTSQTELLKLQCGQTSYPVLISQTVVGQPLHEVFRADPKGAWLSQLDHKAFSQLVLMALLVRPEDGKPDNYVLVTAQDAQGKTVYQLVSVDNDHAFIDSVDFEKKLQGALTIKLQTKTIIFCFDQMQQPLHPEAIEEFLALEPSLVLDAWLKDLQRWNQQAYELFTAAEMEALLDRKKSEEKTSVPIRFKANFIRYVYQTFIQLQTILQQNTTLSAIDIVLQIDPLMGPFYKNALTQTLSPADRFLQLTAENYKVLADGSSLTNLNTLQTLSAMLDTLPKTKAWAAEPQDLQKSIDELKILCLQQQTLDDVKKAFLKGDTQPFENLLLDDFKETIINNIDWRNLVTPDKQPDINLQLTLLRAARSASFRILKLQHCAALNKKLLEKFIKNSPALKVLDVNHCLQLTADKVLEITAACPILDKLNISGLSTESIKIKPSLLQRVPFPRLRYLAARDNPALKRCEIQSTTLLRLSLKQCKNLIELNLVTSQLETLKVNNCANLTEKVFQEGTRKCPQLKKPSTDNQSTAVKPTFFKSPAKIEPTVFETPAKDIDNRDDSSSADYNYLFKVVLIGDSDTTKTNLLSRFVDNNWDKTQVSTIGNEFKLKTIQLDGKIIKLQLWNTSALERFRTITRSYYRDAHGIILCFDITNYRSFSSIREYWMSEIAQYAEKNVTRILVGTHRNELYNREVSFETAKEFADSFGIGYYECCVLSGDNINEPFLKLAEAMVHRVEAERLAPPSKGEVKLKK